MNTFNVGEFVLQHKRTSAAAALSVLLVFGWLGREAASSDNTVSTSKPAFAGRVDARGSSWLLECYGVRSVEVKPGDQLGAMVAKTTIIRQPSSVDERDIPFEVVVKATARADGIETHENDIQAGEYLDLFTSCQSSNQ